MTSRRQILGAIAVGGALVALPAAAQETIHEEAEQHPRIAKAIRELEDAIRYMEAAPHDFGGNKAQAIADSRAAIQSLRRALAYRARKDNH
jgi:hypothetical protein